MTKERIEDMREVVLPFVKKRLLETNYENLGKSDAEEFAREFNEILDLAIKALEQEPTTKNCRTCRNFGTHHGICEICKDNKCWTEKEPTTKNNLGADCISRQATINAVKRIHPVDTDYDCTLYDKVDVMYVLDEMPPVTPQPKHGIWQQTNKNEVNVIPEYKCSECGAEFKGFGFDFDYCPRCGCAMEEEE